jgi:hypothetical protein
LSTRSLHASGVFSAVCAHAAVAPEEETKANTSTLLPSRFISIASLSPHPEA